MDLPYEPRRVEAVLAIAKGAHPYTGEAQSIARELLHLRETSGIVGWVLLVYRFSGDGTGGTVVQDYRAGTEKPDDRDWLPVKTS